MKPFLKFFCCALAIVLAILSCKDSNNNRKPNSKVIKQEKKKDSMNSIQIVNLEEIPFELPDNWIYQKTTDDVKKAANQPNSGFEGIAYNPAKMKCVVTVWQYNVNELKDLLPLFKMDIKAMGAAVEYNVVDNIVHGITDENLETELLWKGKCVQRENNLVFVAVGCKTEFYKEKSSFLDNIFSSIH